MEPLTQKQIDRFNTKYIKGSDCWEWTETLDGKGYGKFYLLCSETPDGRQKQLIASRVAYYVFKNVDPSKRLVCHTCDNRKCVNPDHLFLGTHKDNSKDMVSKGRHSHPFPTKLSDEDVREIKILLSQMNRFSQARIGKLYGVDQTIISRIKLGKR